MLYNTFTHDAMDTEFQISIVGHESDYAESAARAVFTEVDRYERMLNRFNPCSDIAQVNRLKPGEIVRVGLDLLDCLWAVKRLYEDTGGAFDAAVGPLVNCWRDGEGHWLRPGREEIEERMDARVGLDRLALYDSREDDEAEGEDPYEFLAGIEARENAPPEEFWEMDFGGIGKGLVLDLVPSILHEWGIESALVHGGTSTALPIGPGCGPQDKLLSEQGWPLGVAGDYGHLAASDVIILRDRALSGSGTEVRGEHVIDPRTGRPALSHEAAWVLAPLATDADALSTAFMVMSTEEVEAYCQSHSGVAAMLLVDRRRQEPLITFGEW